MIMQASSYFFSDKNVNLLQDQFSNFSLERIHLKGNIASLQELMKS